jgi:tRNA A37 threonylcarbamoyladenosine dehydratase
MTSSAAQAASRVYVIGAGVLGAWAADYLYRR